MKSGVHNVKSTNAIGRMVGCHIPNVKESLYALKGKEPMKLLRIRLAHKFFRAALRNTGKWRYRYWAIARAVSPVRY